MDAVITPGGQAQVLIVDGPNADSLRRLDVAGLTATGMLETTAKNQVARSADARELQPLIAHSIAQSFETSIPLDDGRDLLGAIARAGGSSDAVIVVSTSGGVHRSADLDFLLEVPPPERLDIDPQVAIEFHGIGNVPMPDGQVPSKEFTSSLLALYLGLCELHGDDCEVLR